MKEINGVLYNEKELVILEYIGTLTHYRDKDEKLLSDTEENRKFIKEHYTDKINILMKILKEVA